MTPGSLKDRFCRLWDTNIENLQYFGDSQFLPVTVGRDIWILNRQNPETFILSSFKDRFDPYYFSLNDIEQEPDGLEGLASKIERLIVKGRNSELNVEAFFSEKQLLRI